MSIIVLDPTSGRPVQAATMATALDSLAGRSVGLLDNGKKNVTLFLDEVERVLRERYGVAAVVRSKKQNQNAPAPPEQLAELTVCDAVISAVGD